MIPVELGDERLLLRAPTLADVADIARICRDPEIPRWIGSIPLDYTVDDARWFLTQMVEPGWESGHSLVWLITDRTTGDPYGTVGLHQREQGVAEVGFLLAAWARGHGYMTDAVQLVCEYGFGALGLSRIEWQAVVGNRASRAVAERAGFTFEGVLRGRLQQHDGSGSGERVAADAWIASRLAPAATRAAHDDGPDVVLREGGVELRPWRRDDVDDLVRAHQDDLLQITFDDPFPYTRRDAEDFVASRPSAWAAGCPSFAVVEAASQRLLGSCGVLETNPYQGPEVGYWLAAWARGQGYAEPALRALCRWLFSTGAPRIRWDAQVGNLPSLRTAEAVGFVVEGVQRAAYVDRQGERHDTWTGSLLPTQLRESTGEPLRESWLLPTWRVDPVRLTTARLQLRGLLPADAEWVWELACDPATRQWSPMSQTSMDDAREFARTRGSWGAGRASWAITCSGTPVGLVSLHQVSVDNLGAEVGYRVLPQHRGHGYAVEAVTAVTRWGFEELGLQRLALLHAVGNTPSCLVAQRAGFALEGETRRSYRFGDGELHDEHVHARLASD